MKYEIQSDPDSDMIQVTVTEQRGEPETAVTVTVIRNLLGAVTVLVVDTVTGEETSVVLGES